MPHSSPTAAGRVIGATGAATMYREQEILSASPAQIVLILFDYALGALERSQVVFQEGDHRRAGNELRKAAAAVLELRGSLNLEEGGDVANSLKNLYEFWTPTLLNLADQYDAATVRRITDQVRDIRDGFEGAMHELKKVAVEQGLMPDSTSPVAPSPADAAAPTPGATLKISG